MITCSRHGFPEDCPWEAGPDDHIRVDLADPDNTMQAIAVMKERLKAQGGRLNALVNNAAISPKGEGGARLGSIETDHRDWMQVFQVNFFAPIMLARGLIDELQAGSGAVVNISSIAGSRVHPFAGSAYATSKAALAALTREMAADFAPLGIRVNAISPGEIDTARRRAFRRRRPACVTPIGVMVRCPAVLRSSLRSHLRMTAGPRTTDSWTSVKSAFTLKPSAWPCPRLSGKGSRFPGFA